uniref:Ammonium transporter AmtB-like domain-containing protein n=2 Tax=Cryptomonas curvata TaxID=233186 RepID=A0A7S0QNB2_9CRYP|mmetsp:Transcript_53008/g.110582  ORF Transcript_53008/g.110582 Transcript_53008/m.110582 type:complete len:423 (+) Transcript_53008:402-1670(+)
MFDMNMYTYLGMCLTMTYLRKYAYTSLGMSFLMGCLAQEWCGLLLQWIPLAWCSHLKQIYSSVGCPYGNNPDLTQFDNYQRSLACTCEDMSSLISITVSDFVRGQYGVVAVLVSYGALLGKVNPLQMLLIVVINVGAYCGNKFLCVDYRGGVDNTGSLYTTHIFGAAFGLGVSVVVSGKRPSENPDNSPRYQSNNYAILGSLFMFCTYPSFNAYWAPAALRVYVAANTFAALMAGGMFAFIWANLIYPNGPTVMHLQDGVLAAGVAASTPASMFVSPVIMMIIGAGGTLAATLSFRYLQPLIDDQDTQGITSLHLIPGLWGAAIMIVVCIIGIDNNWTTLDNVALMSTIMPHYGQQWSSTATQAIITGFSICVGGVSGAVTGVVARMTGRIALAGSYSDHVFWIVPDDFTHIGDEDASMKVM